jgi:hypothetical protein
LLLPAGLTAQWQEELREKGGLIVPRLQDLETLVWPDGRSQRLSGLAAALEQDLLIMSREPTRWPEWLAALAGRYERVEIEGLDRCDTGRFRAVVFEAKGSQKP